MAIWRNCSHEAKGNPFTAHQEIRPFINPELTVPGLPNIVYPLGKLVERQGRKITGLRETTAAGLRHECSFVCIFGSRTVLENIEREEYDQPDPQPPFYSRCRAYMHMDYVHWLGKQFILHRLK
jgi:hypothetical protein